MPSSAKRQEGPLGRQIRVIRLRFGCGAQYLFRLVQLARFPMAAGKSQGSVDRLVAGELPVYLGSFRVSPGEQQTTGFAGTLFLGVRNVGWKREDNRKQQEDA